MGKEHRVPARSRRPLAPSNRRHDGESLLQQFLLLVQLGGRQENAQILFAVGSCVVGARELQRAGGSRRRAEGRSYLSEHDASPLPKYPELRLHGDNELRLALQWSVPELHWSELFCVRRSRGVRQPHVQLRFFVRHNVRAGSSAELLDGRAMR